MTVKRKSKSDLLATELDVTSSEYLEFELTFEGAQAAFAVSDQHGIIVFSTQDTPVKPDRWLKRWPTKKVRVPDDLNFVLALHFIAATKYTYRVMRRDQNGKLIEKCKDCTYESKDSTDSYFEPLRIFTF